MFPITEAWDGNEINDAILEEYNASVMEMSPDYLKSKSEKAAKSARYHSNMAIAYGQTSDGAAGLDQVQRNGNPAYHTKNSKMAAKHASKYAKRVDQARLFAGAAKAKQIRLDS